MKARGLLAVLAFVLGLGTLPHRVCERDAGAFYDGDPAAVDALAGSVEAWTTAELTAARFGTGSSRFDDEWVFGTSMMAAMGFGQTALAVSDPGRHARSIARMEHCLDAVLGPGGRRFDHDAWSLDALASLDAAPGSPEDRGHVAYLGYAGLALGLHRVLVPGSRFDRIHDAVAAALERRFVASSTGFVETYPGEVYPVDNASALGALALHAKATGAAPGPGFARGLATLRTRAIRPETGLLAQAADPVDGSPRDPGRGSGTALAAYFLSFADPDLAAALHHALRRELYRTVLGFGVVLEHPDSCAECKGRTDIDSGPVFAGFGVSATGFAIGSSRASGDRDAYVALYATAHLFGAPFDREARRTYATGGPLGDAILFAMLTAPRTVRTSS